MLKQLHSYILETFVTQYLETKSQAVHSLVYQLVRQTRRVVLTADDAWSDTITASLFPAAVMPSWLF